VATLPLPTREDTRSSDHQLVAAVRRGDDRAFECLYERYRSRIQAYVASMCKDHGRAEDITQEIFVAALRRMRETERPIAFKPWIYEIAKNACIDQHRRSRRAKEVSLQAEEGLAPADYGRLIGSDPEPDAAVAAKQDLEDLCGAFGGLSKAHHEILVMRELEGLSYREIGERLGMTRPSVESTLFRARRRLTEEYDDLVSGRRCLRIQGIIATAARGRLGARDTRRLARHVAHCQPCRREALGAGLDAALLTTPSRSAAAKVAALLPFPGLGWAKAAAAIVVIAGTGAGVEILAAHDGQDPRTPARSAPAREVPPPAPTPTIVPRERGDAGATPAARPARPATARRERAARRDGSAAGAPAGAPAGAGTTGSPSAPASLPAADAIAVPRGTTGAADAVVRTADEVVSGVAGAVTGTVEAVGDAAAETAAPVQDTAAVVQGAVDDATAGLTP
jgi:RNA polymerase sigma factor (sigma-70 family)